MHIIYILSVVIVYKCVNIPRIFFERILYKNFSEKREWITETKHGKARDSQTIRVAQSKEKRNTFKRKLIYDR